MGHEVMIFASMNVSQNGYPPIWSITTWRSNNLFTKFHKEAQNLSWEGIGIPREVVYVQNMRAQSVDARNQLCNQHNIAAQEISFVSLGLSVKPTFWALMFWTYTRLLLMESSRAPSQYPLSVYDQGMWGFFVSLCQKFSVSTRFVNNDLWEVNLIEGATHSTNCDRA